MVGIFLRGLLSVCIFLPVGAGVVVGKQTCVRVCKYEGGV
jgi:hypothetical protein